MAKPEFEGLSPESIYVPSLHPAAGKIPGGGWLKVTSEAEGKIVLGELRSNLKLSMNYKEALSLVFNLM